MRLNRCLLAQLIVISVVNCAAPAHAETDARDLMRAVEQWVELTDTRHRERVEWEATRASLEQGIDLLAREKALLEARIAEHSAEADVATDEELAIEQRRTAQNNALRDANVQLADWPDTKADTPLPDTLSTVFNSAIAAQRDNQTIRFDQQLLDTPDATQLLMDVLYLGHAQAYAVSRHDQTAAHGVWNGAAWTWSWDPRHAPAIREAIRVQQGELTPRWTRLPVTVLFPETER